MLSQQFERGAGHLDGGERVDDDPPHSRVDERNGRNVEAAHLIDAICDLKEAVLGQYLRLAPQAGVGGFRRFAFQEFVRREIERRPPAAVAGDHRVGARGDETSIGEIEVLAVVGGDQGAGLVKRSHPFPPRAGVGRRRPLETI